RRESLKGKSLCHCCFSSKHSTNDCCRKCPNCTGKHHRSLCEKPSLSVNTSLVSSSNQLRLFTATATIENPNLDAHSATRAYIHLDHGSQATLISRDLVNRLSLHFDETIQKQDNEYIVQYSVKPHAKDALPTNYDLQRSYLEFYDSIIHDQLSLGQIELVDSSDTEGVIHFLAHQPVLRPDKPTTPPGPSDLEQIPALLLRARSRLGLIVADVDKAFLQVKLHPPQRNMSFDSALLHSE
ncbi:hypothetical protein PENTCL1PPCAC_1453, partial [Pristionchus entomophagus]